MAKTQSWEVSDELWQNIQPLVPKPPAAPGAQAISASSRRRAQAVGGPANLRRHCLCAAHRMPVEGAAQSFGSASSRFTHTFNAGADRDSSWRCGGPVWPRMTRWKALPGSGKALTGRKAKRRWRRKRWATTPPIGEKKAASAACWWTVLASRCPLSSAGPTGMMSNCWRSLWIALWSCAPKPAGGGGKTCVRTRVMRGVLPQKPCKPRGYTPHVRQRGEEARACRQGQRARRWVVEHTHSWFNRFRKLLVRYEKTAANFLALLQCAAALIFWRMC